MRSENRDAKKLTVAINLRHPLLIQFHRIVRGIEQERSIVRGNEITQIKSVPRFPSYAYFAAH